MPELAPAVWSAVFLALAAGVQGFLGFGFGMVAMSLLTLSHDLVHAAGVVNVMGLLVNAGSWWSLRGHVLWPVVRRMAPAVVLGVVAGVTLLSTVDPTWMVRALGATIIAISIWNLVTPRLEDPPESLVLDVVIGGIGGVLGGAFNTGGPPMVAHVYRRHDPPAAIKSTIFVLFVCVGVARLPVAVAQGQMTPAVWRDSAIAALFVLAAMWIGLALGRRVPAERFRTVSWVALAGMGLVLLLGA